jgi:hypothetical protein
MCDLRVQLLRLVTFDRLEPCVRLRKLRGKLGRQSFATTFAKVIGRARPLNDGTDATTPEGR